MFVQEKPSSLFITMADMCDILNEMHEYPEMIVMKYLPGCEYTVDLLADHGKVLYMAGRKNTDSIASIAMKSFVEKRETAYEMCKNIVELLELDGNIGFDFMLDENDMPVLTDLNPRITATIILFLAAGINFPYLRVKQLLGETLPDIEIKYGVQLIRKYEDVLISSSGIINA
jgi:carbamoyl-phosphate synthase large subunit